MRHIATRQHYNALQQILPQHMQCIISASDPPLKMGRNENVGCGMRDSIITFCLFPWNNIRNAFLNTTECSNSTFIMP